ncbi:MAG: ATP synthase F1 subunit delta [Clostridia bacterium]|nr:ATP synthase F1 subunit delta [Clostridia bacterium]
MTELAREYGEGLYALTAEEQVSGDVLEQLNSLKNCFREQPEFLKLLSNMSLGKAERVGILDKALRGQVHPYVLNFLKILCERGVLYEFEGCEAAFREAYNQDHGIVQATVTTAAPLAEKQRQALKEKLARITGRQVSLTEKVDAAVMGGVLLEMDGQRYDNTVRTRLAAIRQAMTQDA